MSLRRRDSTSSDIHGRRPAYLGSAHQLSGPSGGIPVALTCRVLTMARQAYYRWLVDAVSEAQMLRAHRVNALVDAHGSDPEYGYRLLRDEAETNGWVMSRRTA